MKNIALRIALIGLITSASTEVYSQSILRKIEKAKSSIENVGRNADKKAEKSAEKEANKPRKTEKSTLHNNLIGKIKFAAGTANPQLQDESQFVQTVDLSSPAYFNAYLEQPLYTQIAELEKLREYDRVSPGFTRKYYINNELIATYMEQMDETKFKTQDVLTDVLVPSNSQEKEENKLKLQLLSHVVSSLTPGTHKLKVEYEITVNEAIPDEYGVGYSYKHKQLLVASGEVNLNINANELTTYCKTYGRPKFSKGVLEGNPKIENQVIALVKQHYKRQAIYVYGEDHWKIQRGSLDRILSRDVLCYYVFINEKGRAEIGEIMIRQDFDGQNYLAAKDILNKTAPGFKFASKQNY